MLKVFVFGSVQSAGYVESASTHLSQLETRDGRRRSAEAASDWNMVGASLIKHCSMARWS